MSEQTVSSPAWQSWLAIIAIVFGLLLLASHASELMTQLVIAPDTAADNGVVAACRADELEEENLSLAECELMVANLQMRLASQPNWFRTFQIVLSSGGTIVATLSIIAGFGLLAGQTRGALFAATVFALLTLIDVSGFIAATMTGPLLRAIYLEKLLLWFFLHLSLLTATVSQIHKSNSSHDGGLQS